MDNEAELRATYEEIRSTWFWYCYQTYRREVRDGFYAKEIEKDKSVIEQVAFSVAYEALEDAYFYQAERLMLEVVAVMASAGRFTRYEKFHREKVTLMLEDRTLQDILCDVPEDEMTEFLADVRLLKLLPD